MMSRSAMSGLQYLSLGLELARKLLEYDQETSGQANPVKLTVQFGVKAHLKDKFSQHASLLQNVDTFEQNLND